MNTHDADLTDAIPVVHWDVARVAVIDETGASEVTYLRMIDARDEEVVSLVLDPAVASWLAWAIIGVAGGLMDSYGVFTDESDE